MKTLICFKSDYCGNVNWQTNNLKKRKKQKKKKHAHTHICLTFPRLFYFCWIWWFSWKLFRIFIVLKKLRKQQQQQTNKQTEKPFKEGCWSEDMNAYKLKFLSFFSQQIHLFFFFLFFFSSSKFKDLLQRKAYFMIMQDEPRLTLKMSSPYPLILTLICPFSLSVVRLCVSLSLSLTHTHNLHICMILVHMEIAN